MENSVASSFAKTGQALADKAVRKVQDGMTRQKMRELRLPRLLSGFNQPRKVD